MLINSKVHCNRKNSSPALTIVAPINLRGYRRSICCRKTTHRRCESTIRFPMEEKIKERAHKELPSSDQRYFRRCIIECVKWLKDSGVLETTITISHLRHQTLIVGHNSEGRRDGYTINYWFEEHPRPVIAVHHNSYRQPSHLSVWKIGTC